jgi:MoaA/NifB/PqqE/SkfB family radical SAM enzyme
MEDTMARMRHQPMSKYLTTMRYAFSNFVAKEQIYPFYCSFKVVQRCDSRCEFCNVWKYPIPDLPTQTVFRVVDNIANSSILLLSIEGGEPLLRDDIGEILRYIRTKPLFLLFTTSGKLFDKRPMKEYAKYIDFLHISIDEGHQNLELYDRLPEFVAWGPIVCAQIVVMRDHLKDLEEKIRACHAAGAKAVIMPACHLPDTRDLLPDLMEFRDEVFRLKKKYPRTIITTDKYLRTLDVPHSCNTASIIIDSDGLLHYPCRTLMEKSIDASKESLLDFVASAKARECRSRMDQCDKQCHWYQYFATDSFISLRSGLSALEPYISDII